MGAVCEPSRFTLNFQSREKIRRHSFYYNFRKVSGVLTNTTQPPGPRTHCSSQTTAAEYRSPPMPPCCSAMLTPRSPCFPAFSQSSLLTSPVFSHLQKRSVGKSEKLPSHPHPPYDFKKRQVTFTNDFVPKCSFNGR